MLDDFKYPEPDPNKKSAQQTWDERYQSEEYLFGKEPSPFLKHQISALKKSKAIDIGAGEGRNSVFLAEQGFEVEAIDCSSKGVEKIGRLAAAKKVNVTAKVQNLDFFLMPLMRYDTIIMTYFRPQARFFSEIRRGLVPGGTFLLEAYVVEHLRAQSVPNPLIDFEECYKANEVLGLLKDFHVLYYKEIPEGTAHLVQAIVQKRK